MWFSKLSREAWRYLMALDAGEDPPEPAWLDRPAVTQMSIPTPGYWRLFDPWNEGKSFAEGVKPFGFMLVAYADPTRTSNVGRLVHPYERDPKKWMKTEWADLYEPARKFWIAVRRLRQVAIKPGVVYVRTYRDAPPLPPWSSRGEVVGGRRRSMPSKHARTSPRRPVEALSVTHIGKEGNRLEERLAGLSPRGRRYSGSGQTAAGNLFDALWRPSPSLRSTPQPGWQPQR